jgi:PAS domain S-box-containing protein
LWEALLKQMPDAIVFADRGGVIRFWNHGAEAVFGFAALLRGR